MTEPAYFYYIGDEQLSLELVDDTLAVGFSEPISQRRLDELRASDRRIDILGQSRGLLQRNVLVYRVGAVAHGAERLRRFAEHLLASPRVRFVRFVFRDPADGTFLITTDELVARFRPQVTAERVAALAAELGASVASRSASMPQEYILHAAGADPAATLMTANALHLHPETEWAAPNFVREKRLELQARQWHLNHAGGQPGLANEDSRVRGPVGDPLQRAWAVTRGDAAVVVAVLDTGVDMAHPGINLAPGGRDFDVTPPDDDPTPGSGPNDPHGTACAGVVAGRGGLTDGVAPECRVLAIKMMGASDSQTAEAIRYAAANARVLSNSWTAGRLPATEAAIGDVIAQRGTIVVFAAGNQNFPVRAGPQDVLGVILVGAANNIGGRSGYSNFARPDPDTTSGRQYLVVLGSSDGTSSDVALWQANLAPAVPANGPFEHDGSSARIYTTDMRGAAGYNQGLPASVADPANTPTAQPDYTGTFGGTSSACPLVAGVCALMASVNRDLSPVEVRYILEATADKIGTATARHDCPTATAIPAGRTASYSPATGYDGFTHSDGQRYSRYGFGRVNAEQAVRGAQNQPIRQYVPALNAYQDAIPVVLRRVPGTNQFVSTAELELIDARRDAEAPPPAGLVRVRAAPGGEIQASFQPTGGAPTISDAISVQGAIR